MWINKAKYGNLLKCLDEAICNNYELRKVCQCRECRRYGLDYIERGKAARCYNSKSDNYDEIMNPYGSCEKCERI